MKNLRKFISVVLALIMMLSTFSLNAFAVDVSEETDTGAANVLNFDANTSGWNNFKKVFCHIWVYNGDSFYAWQAKGEACTDDDGDGIWTYDLDLKGLVLEQGKFYGVIFSNENGMQTYDLLFDTSVLGDTAYCDGSLYDSPEDSSKKVMFAYWRNQDKADFGPAMSISSIGNIIGTAIPAYGYEKYALKCDMFKDFLINKLENARTYSGKADQQIIDDVALVLGLIRSDVSYLILETGISTDWNIDDSILDGGIGVPDTRPDHPMTSGNVLHFDANTTEWKNYKKIFCHIWEWNGDSFYAWQAKGEACTDEDGDGVWTYDLDARGVDLEDGQQYGVIFSNENGAQTYNLLFDKTVLGDTAYCDNDIIYEAPEDSVKNPTIAFWCNQDPSVFGPEMRITSNGNVIGTCIPATISRQLMFREFLVNSLENARMYSGKTDQQLLDDLAVALGLDDEEVEAAIKVTGVEVKWSADGEDDNTSIIGDVDRDGTVSVMDATEIQLVLAQMKPFVDETAKANADFDGDGAISVMDATEIQLKLVGIK